MLGHPGCVQTWTLKEPSKTTIRE